MFNKQKGYFRSKADGVQKMIWDLEFKRFKTRELREEVRQEYDALYSRLNTVKAQIKAQLKSEKICPVHNPPKGTEKIHKSKATCECDYIDKAMSRDDIERLYDQVERMEKDREQMRIQLRQLDVEIEGCKPCQEYHDGVQGVTQQLDALRELKQMIADYIRQI